MIRAYYKDNPQQYKDFEDFLFLFPARHNLVFDFGSDTIFIDSEKFTLSKVQFIADNTEDFERYELKEHKNQPEGYAGLDSEAKIPPELLPPIRVVDVHVVQTLAERDALTGIDEGDLAVVVSEDKTYVWTGSEWLEIRAQGSVLAVEGRTGNVTLSDLFAAKEHEHTSITDDGSYIEYIQHLGDNPLAADVSYIKEEFTASSYMQFNEILTYSAFALTNNFKTYFDRCKIMVGSNVVYDDTVMYSLYYYDNVQRTKYRLKKKINVSSGKKVSIEFFSGEEIQITIRRRSGHTVTHNDVHVVNPAQDWSLIYSLRNNFKNQVFIESNLLTIEDIYGSIPSLPWTLSHLKDTQKTLQDTVSNNQGRIIDLESYTDELDNNVLPRLAKDYLYNTGIDGSERAFLRIAKTTAPFAIKFLLIENNTNYPTRPVEITLRHASRSSADQNWSGDFPTGYLSGIQEIGIYDGGDGYWYVMPVAPPLYVEDVDVQVLYSTAGFEYVEVPRGSAWTHLYSLVST